MKHYRVTGLQGFWFVLVWLFFATMETGYAQNLPSASYDLALSKGIHALNEKRYDEAQADFQEALRAKPGEVQATYYLGAAQRYSGQYETALESLKAAAQHDPSFQPVHFDLGVVAFHLERYEEALAELFKAESSEPESGTRQAMTQYYLGLTFQKLERFNEATSKLLRAAALSPELTSNAHYLAGVAFYRQGIWDEAEDAFKKVIQTVPGSPMASSSRMYLKEIEQSRPNAKAWRVAASLTAQYDSNVILLPGDAPLPQAISGKSDLRWVGMVEGILKVFENARWTGTAKYNLYQSWHQDLHAFNVQNHDLGLMILHRRPNRPYQFQFGYDFSDALLDSGEYLLTHTGSVTAGFSRNRSRLTEVHYRYRHKDFRASDLFPNNDRRTGINHAAGINQYWFFFEQKGNFHGGYTYDRDLTAGDDWDNRGHRFNLGVTLPPFYVQPALEAELTLRKYDHSNSLSTKTPPEAREDTIQLYTLTFSRSFTGWLSGAVQYLYNINASKIGAYDYVRQIVSISVMATF